MASKQFEIKPTFFNKETKRFEKTPVLEPDTKVNLFFGREAASIEYFVLSLIKVSAPSAYGSSEHLLLLYLFSNFLFTIYANY